jgi:hypothetical protein
MIICLSGYSFIRVINFLNILNYPGVKTNPAFVSAYGSIAGKYNRLKDIKTSQQ